MPNVTFMRGLPASGKSTIARKLAAKTGALRINLDSIRDMFAQPWSKEHEKFVQKQQTVMALNALRSGQDVIFDNTNLHAKQAKAFAIEAWECGFDVNYTVIDATADGETCFIRNQRRGTSPTADDSKVVPDEAMRRMEKEFAREKQRGLWTVDGITAGLPVVEPYIPDLLLPNAYIVDIDGTMARATTRGPYDLDRLAEDEYWEHVCALIAGIDMLDIYVIVMSGRDSLYRSTTEAWMNKGGIPWENFFMRPEGDSRRDSIIKLELFNEHVRGKYNVLGAIDDRQRVVRMWHQLGIPVIRVGDPDSDF